MVFQRCERKHRLSGGALIFVLLGILLSSPVKAQDQLNQWMNEEAFRELAEELSKKVNLFRYKREAVKVEKKV